MFATKTSALFGSLLALGLISGAQGQSYEDPLEPVCSLSAPSLVAPNQAFSFQVAVENPYVPPIFTPYPQQVINLYPPLTGVFYGSGLPADGPGFAHYTSFGLYATLDGYANTPGSAGHYTRYLVITDIYGQTCTTNTIGVELR
jgi:hypothetical protein